MSKVPPVIQYQANTLEELYAVCLVAEQFYSPDENMIWILTYLLEGEWVTESYIGYGWAYVHSAAKAAIIVSGETLHITFVLGANLVTMYSGWEDDDEDATGLGIID